jgi:hypothetical protein
MSYTISNLKSLGNEVTAVVDSVESGVGYMYLGTDVGDVYKYNTSSEALTKLKNVGGKVLSLTLYSSKLYVGVAGGKLISMATT